MKKIVMSFLGLAMAALMTVSCGGNAGAGAGTTTYTNEKYGFSVEVPGNLRQIVGLLPEEGTVFSADPDGGMQLNRIDITGSEELFGEEYSQEKIKSDLEFWGENASETELFADGFTFTRPGEITEITKHVYKGTKKVMVTIYYDADHADQLGGDVAQKVFDSIKFL